MGIFKRKKAFFYPPYCPLPPLEYITGGVNSDNAGGVKIFAGGNNFYPPRGNPVGGGMPPPKHMGAVLSCGPHFFLELPILVTFSSDI